MGILSRAAPLAALAAVCINASSALATDVGEHPTFALWPQHLDAELSLSYGADGVPVVESSLDGVLGTFNMKLEAPSELPFDPLVESVEITWVPSTDAPSPTFDRFFSNSPRFTAMNAVGIHLHARLIATASWASINETRHDQIEANVRGILEKTLHKSEIAPSLSKGFLAKSVCDFSMWQRDVPLQSGFDQSDSARARSLQLCYSSSFPYSASSFGSQDGDNSRFSTVERMLLTTDRYVSEDHRQRRLAVMKFTRGSAPSSIQAEYLEVWTSAPKDSEKRWTAAIPSDAVKANFVVITSIQQVAGHDKLEYTWLPHTERSVTTLDSVKSSSSFEFQVPKTTVAASARALITGEGFHRRYALDLELLETELCDEGPENKTILVLVPISNTAYVDLDEIRRMERFGQLRLRSFTKHIEIERPSPVSPQHVIGLEFVMFVERSLETSHVMPLAIPILTRVIFVHCDRPPSTHHLHVDFPIHFRYQAPSAQDQFRQASIIAPEAFLLCSDTSQTGVNWLQSIESHADEGILRYLQTWGITYKEAAASTSQWRRLSLRSPLAVVEVLTPVGFLPSGSLVSSVTLTFASLGAALLLWISIGAAKRAQRPSGDSTANWKAKQQ